MSIKHFFKKNGKFFTIYHYFLDFVFPKKCCLCGDVLYNDFLCRKCDSGIVEINQNKCCKICGYPLPDFQQTCNFLDKKQKVICPSCKSGKRCFNVSRSVFQYKNIIRKTILNLKFYFQIDGLVFFGDKMNEVYRTMPNVDYICFIPITRMKLFYKGYNHAGLIAKYFFYSLKKNNNFSAKEVLLYDLLIKTKKTKSSKKLSQNDRWLKRYNFEINKKYQKPYYINNFSGKSFLIIDDIMTTGATLNIASKIIKDCYPNSKVYCLTLARTMLY